MKPEPFRRTSQGLEAFLDETISDTIAVNPAFCIGSDQFVDRRADPHQGRRQLKHLPIGAIPSDQTQVGIVDRHAVACDVDCVLQNVPAVLDLEGDVVGDTLRRVARHLAFLHDHGHDETRGRRADDRGDQMLGHLDEAGVRVTLQIHLQVGGGVVVAKRAMCSFLPGKM